MNTKCLAAHTPSNTQIYPPYINISQNDDEVIVTMREAPSKTIVGANGNEYLECGKTIQMSMPVEEARKVLQSALDGLNDSKPKVSNSDITDQMRLATDQLLARGNTWMHYKGGIYKVLGLVWLTETQEVGVKYERIAGPNFNLWETSRVYVRPLSIWNSPTESGQPRFARAHEVTRWEPRDK